MTCPAAKRVSLKSHAQPELVSPNQGGPITKKIKLSKSEQRISASDGSNNRITRIGEDETIRS